MKPTPVETRVFLDSNILLYILSADKAKAERAHQLIDSQPFISVQVLNELVNVAGNKLKMDWTAIRDALNDAREDCTVLPLTEGVHIKAVDISENHLINIYDANIVAAAILSGCDILYTEDLNHGQRIGGLEIRNPFLAE